MELNSLSDSRSNNSIYNCGGLTSLYLPSLLYVVDNFISSCGKLSFIYAPLLETISNYSGYFMNTTFIGEYAEFPNLTYCNSGLFISAPNLRNNPCPNLEYWESGTYDSASAVFWGDCNTQTLIFPNLETIHPDNVNAAFFKNGNIEELYLPRLKKIYTVYYGTWNAGGMLAGSFPNLKKIVLGNIITQASIFGAATANVPNLIHLEFASLGVECKLSKWALSEETYSENYTTLIEDDICDSNYEQFLYNFKNYIIDRLVRMSSKINLTLPSSLYNVVTSSELSKFTENVPYNQWLNQALSTKNWGLAYV